MKAFATAIPLALGLAMHTAAAGPGGIGVICAQPAEMLLPAHWQALTELNAMPELLCTAEGGHDGAPYLFDAFEKELSAFASRGFAVAVTITAHLPSLPMQPSVDDRGEAHVDRHNPFDPAFRREWRRWHEAFAARYGEDGRISRVYVAPPSYYGEAEYYMGRDWADLRFLAYGPLAREAFLEGMKERYATPGDVAEAWGVSVVTWDDVEPPTREWEGPGPRLETAWLDFMTWRTAWLTDLAVGEVRHLARHFHGEVGLKTAIGDYTAMHGTDGPGLVRSSVGDGAFALHMTNGHSLPDMRYAAAQVRRYGAAAWTTENDGNRYGRTELAKLLLNSLLTGVDQFNFAHVPHLVTSPISSVPTETHRALFDFRRTFFAWRTEPPRKRVAFLHSKTTTYVRPPLYRNRDVSHAYDPALANGGRLDAWGFAWARWLDMPDVTGEKLVIDGDLDGRDMLILPSTGPVLLPAETRGRVMDWVEEGGTLVAFGEESLRHTLHVDPSCRVESAEGRFPGIAAGRVRGMDAPVWDGPLPQGWHASLAGASGSVAAAATELGRGRILLFAGHVPRATEDAHAGFHGATVPAFLRDTLAARGWRPWAALYESDGVTPSTSLVVDYVGQDPVTGTHRFVAGAWDGRDREFVLKAHPSLKGAGELLLVDIAVVEADGPGVSVAAGGPSRAELYRNPTAAAGMPGSYIPCGRVMFDAGTPLSFRF